MKVKKYGSGREGDTTNGSRNGKKDEWKRKKGLGHRLVTSMVEIW